MSARERAGPRIVITGMGALTDLGLDAAATWRGMREGSSGIRRISGEGFDRELDKWAVTIAGQVQGFDPDAAIDPREARRLDRFTQLGVAAGIQAVQQSGIEFGKLDPERCGVCIGSGVGGISTIEESVKVLEARGGHRINPFTVPRLMVNAVAGNLSIRYGLMGPAGAHATACASSGHAIADAVTQIRLGRADVMLAGGAEAAVTPLCIGAFMTMKALSTRNDEPTRASRPFDQDRDGFVLAEGAACFVLETEAHARARGATILGELVGSGNSCDASHITAPDSEGRGAARSMRWALEDAGLDPTDIDYINAHGTSTPLGDKAEVAAVLSVFGDHARKSTGGKLRMSSTKSVHGHTLGASGAVELVACLGAIREGVVPPTINLEKPDEGADVHLVPNQAENHRVRYAMNNTFGFGGHNVTLIVGRYDA